MRSINSILHSINTIYRQKNADKSITLRQNVSAKNTLEASRALRDYYAHINVLDDLMNKKLRETKDEFLTGKVYMDKQNYP